MPRFHLWFAVGAGAVAVLAGAHVIAAQNTMNPASPGTARPATQAPAPPRMSTFTMSGLSFRFPIPSGFCTPVGRYAAHAQNLATGDGANHTSLSFSDCGSMARGGDLLRWGMIKTPRNLVYTNVGSLPSVITELKRQFDSGEFLRQMNQGVATAAGDQRFATTARPLGTDPYGAYVGGTLTIDNRTMAAAWGMTAIKGRLFAVYIYGPYGDASDVQDVINRARTATRNFVNANPGG